MKRLTSLFFLKQARRRNTYIKLGSRINKGPITILASTKGIKSLVM